MTIYCSLEEGPPPSLELKENWYSWFGYKSQISEVTLVGGTGPHEGNILVGGLPVCDDGHDAQNALVVCRFAKNRNLKCIFPFCKFFRPRISHHISLGCWGTLTGNPLWNHSLDQSPAPSRWTRSSAWALKPPSLTAPTTLWMIVEQEREQASFAQLLVGWKHSEQKAQLGRIRHDICQIFYTSHFSNIYKFTRRKRVSRNIFSPFIWQFSIFIPKILIISHFFPCRFT